MNLWLTFLTGLTTGGFTYLALQSGLLVTVKTDQIDKQDSLLETNL